MLRAGIGRGEKNKTQRTSPRNIREFPGSNIVLQTGYPD
jgi:hypothetical protein